MVKTASNRPGYIRYAKRSLMSWVVVIPKEGHNFSKKKNPEKNLKKKSKKLLSYQRKGGGGHFFWYDNDSGN